MLYHYVKGNRPATMNNRIEISTVVTVQEVEGCSFVLALNCDGECDNGSASAGDSEGIAVKFILSQSYFDKNIIQIQEVSLWNHHG